MGCGTSFDQDYVGQFNQNSQLDSQQSNQDKQQQKFQTGQKITLKICTLNLGEYQSPFKLFHRSFKRLGQEDGEDLQKQELEQRKLNDKFIDICQRYNYKIKQKYINENLIKLQKITKQRYTVLYRKNIGVKKDDTLMNEKQFIEEWQKQFEQISKQISEDPSHQFDLGMEQQLKLAKKQLLKFDTICYHTMLSYVYGLNNLDIIISQNLAYKYCLFMNNKFSKSQFDLIEKIKNLENFMKKLSIDIAFAHEITPKYMRQIRQQFSSYRIVEPSANGSSAIFIKGQLIIKLEPKYRNYTLSGLNFRYIESADQSICNKYQDSEQRNANQVLKQIEKRREKMKQQRQKHIQDLKHRESVLSGNQSGMKQSKIQASQMLRPLNPHHDLNQSLIESEQNIQIQEKTITNCEPKITIKKKDKLTIEQLHNFRLTQDCVLQFVGCFILISMRISEYSQMKDKKMKSSVNLNQVERIKKVLMQLKKRFPRHRIIVGLNTPVSRDQQIKDQFLDHLEVFRQKYKNKQQPFSFVPDVYSLVDDYQQEDRHMIGKQKIKRVVQKKGFYTSIYKKTNFNIDRKQINYEYTGVDSFLISNGKLENGAVYNCTAEKISDQSTFQNFIQYTPNEKHPFASLFIYSELQVQLLEVVFNKD